MATRIAPSPIDTSVAVGDGLAHARESRTPARRDAAPPSQQSPHHPAGHAAAPLPHAPPDEAFTAAVLAGQMPPRPLTAEQLRQRRAGGWQPPASPFRLADKTA